MGFYAGQSSRCRLPSKRTENVKIPCPVMRKPSVNEFNQSTKARGRTDFEQKFFIAPRSCIHIQRGEENGGKKSIFIKKGVILSFWKTLSDFLFLPNTAHFFGMRSEMYSPKRTHAPLINRQLSVFHS